MAEAGLRLSRVHRIWIYLTLLILLISGVVWLVEQYLLLPVNEFSIPSSNIAPIALSIHGAAAMVFLILIGTLVSNHILVGLKGRRNKLSGMIMVVLNISLIFTGFLLYYSTSELLRSSASISHSIAGLLIPAVLFFHQKRFFRKNKLH